MYCYKFILYNLIKVLCLNHNYDCEVWNIGNASFTLKVFVFQMVEFYINQKLLFELHLTVRAKALSSDSLCQSLALADELPYCVSFYSFACTKTSIEKMCCYNVNYNVGRFFVQSITLNINELFSIHHNLRL